MLAVFAEFERDILRDRVKADLIQSRKGGRPHGRPPTVVKYASRVRAFARKGFSKVAIHAASASAGPPCAAGWRKQGQHLLLQPHPRAMLNAVKAIPRGLDQLLFFPGGVAGGLRSRLEVWGHDQGRERGDEMDDKSARKPLDCQTKAGGTDMSDVHDTQTADDTEICEAQIRERAFEIYLERGGVDGLDESDWFQAEKELRDGSKSRGQKA
jgi:hypothetical protein